MTGKRFEWLRAVLVAIAVSGCSGEAYSGSQSASTRSTAESLGEAFLAALEVKDLDALLALMYPEAIEQWLEDLWRKGMEGFLGDVITGFRIDPAPTDLKSAGLEFTYERVDYVPSLEVTAELVIEGPPGNGGSFCIGKKDGVFYIVTSKPAD